jgi:hypothetical protein
MSYERDPDRAIKGVGAIAARDAGNRQRQVLRAKQARATRARDRSMSHVTYGPRGGMSALGATKLNGGGGTGTSTQLKLTGQTGGLPPPFLPPVKNFGGGTAANQLPYPYPNMIVVDPVPQPYKDPLTGGTTISIDPNLVGGTPATLVGGTTATYGTGTAGQQSGGTPPSSIDPIMEPPQTIDLPPIPTPTTDTTDNTKLYLLLGAGALAAYFLFRKKNGGGGT